MMDSFFFCSVSIWCDETLLIFKFIFIHLVSAHNQTDVSHNHRLVLCINCWHLRALYTYLFFFSNFHFHHRHNKSIIKNELKWKEIKKKTIPFDLHWKKIDFDCVWLLCILFIIIIDLGEALKPQAQIGLQSNKINFQIMFFRSQSHIMT